MFRTFLLVLVATAQSATVQESLDAFCKNLKTFTGAEFKTEKDQQQAAAKFAGMYASKVDCSFDPYDPVVGYDLKDTSLSKCVSADYTGWNKLKPDATQKMVSYECIETIADEEKKTGAVWSEVSFTIGGGEPITARMAARLAFNEKNLITSYHTVADAGPAEMKYKCQESPAQDEWTWTAHGPNEMNLASTSLSPVGGVNCFTIVSTVFALASLSFATIMAKQNAELKSLQSKTLLG